MPDLSPALKLPTRFTLRSVPKNDTAYSVEFITPEETQTLGTFTHSEMLASVFLKVFPDWKPNSLVKMLLSSIKLPPQFEITAAPGTSCIDFNITVKQCRDWPLPTASWGRQIPVAEWGVAQLTEMLQWLRDLQKKAKSHR